MAINTGFVRAGWACVAGACFIFPAAVITGAFAWTYVRFGALPQSVAVLGGIKPAVIALIAIAIWRLGKPAIKDVGLAFLGALSLAAFFLGLSPLLILLGGGFAGMLARHAWTMRGSSAAVFPPLFARPTRFVKLAVVTSAGAIAEAAKPSLGRIALFFLKIGAVVYGGGYVLLAFLEQGLSHQHGWLTHQQLLDAIAIGQFTPGPVFSTATFIGYILGGVPGAVVATVAIFLPSFFYVALLAPVLFRLRQSPWMAAFLDSVNVCAVALMAGVTFRLGADALRAWPSWVIAAGALAVLLRWKVNSAWVVLGGGMAGLMLSAWR